MIQNVLRDIGSIGLYGVISVCLFFTVFTGAVLWALIQNRDHLHSLSQLPLESDLPSDNPKPEVQHE